MEKLSLNAARNLILAVQGLLAPPVHQASREDVLTCIRKMGVLQIDTIHVVARSPYLVLFSRLGAYSPAWLDDLLADGCLFEYWAHAACFIPIGDYPLFRRAMIDGAHPYISKEWLESHQDAIKNVLERICNEGPLRSAHFEQSQRAGPWWGWKDEKIVLEHLHSMGELMIARRDKFQRVYDLRQRVLPGWDDKRVPDVETVRRDLVLRTVKYLGVAPQEWIADYYRMAKKGLPELLKECFQQGELLEGSVEGFETPFYIHPANLPLYKEAASGQLTPSHTTLLSPFDPLVWDRQRARRLFGFDYTIEAYLPPVKRRYGYFSLPILRRGTLIGRLDAKAHRSEKRFEVRSLHLEDNVEADELLLMDLAGALQGCANWHNCPQVSVTATSPAGVVERLNKVIGNC
jgi:uncharacterized protein YcaQ